VTSAEGIAACKEKGADAARCDANDNADCQEDYYCRHMEDDSYMCVRYMNLGTEGCSSTRLCDPETGFCDYIDDGGGEGHYQCVGLLEAGDTCDSQHRCGTDLYCRHYYDDTAAGWLNECASYVGLDQACGIADQDLRCSPGLYCGPESTCLDSVDICDFTGGGLL
jgi:hypothetical protein